MASTPFTFKFVTENSSSSTGASQIAWSRTNPTPIPPPNYTTFLTRNQIQPSGPGSTAASLGLRSPRSTPEYNDRGALCVYSMSQYAFRPRKRMDKHIARKLPAAQRASYRAAYEVPPVVQSPHWSSVDTAPDTQMQVQSTNDATESDPPTFTWAPTTCDPKLTYNDPMQYQDQEQLEEREQDSRFVHREHSYSDSEDDVENSNADAEGDPERDTSSPEPESFICRYNTSCMRTSMLDSEFVQGSSTQASSSSSLKIRIPPRSRPPTTTTTNASQPSEAGLAELEARFTSLLTVDKDKKQGKKSESIKSTSGSIVDEPLFSLSPLSSAPSSSSPVDQRAPASSFSFSVPFALGGKVKEKDKSIAGAQRANSNTTGSASSSVFGPSARRFDPWEPPSSVEVGSTQFSNQLFAPHSKPQVHTTVLPPSTSTSTSPSTSTSTSTKRKRDRSDEGEVEVFDEEEGDVPGAVKTATSQKDVFSDNKKAGGTGAASGAEGGGVFKFEFTHPLLKTEPSTSESCTLDQVVEVESTSSKLKSNLQSVSASKGTGIEDPSPSSSGSTQQQQQQRSPPGLSTSHSTVLPTSTLTSTATSTSTATKRKRDRSDEGEGQGDEGEGEADEVSVPVKTTTSQTDLVTDKKDAGAGVGGVYKFEFTHPVPTSTSESTLGPVNQAVESTGAQDSSSSSLVLSTTSSVDGTAEERGSGGAPLASSTARSGGSAAAAQLQARSLATLPSSPQVDLSPVHNATTPVTNPSPPQMFEPTPSLDSSSPSTAGLTSTDSNSSSADSTSSASVHVRVPQSIQPPAVEPTLSSPTAGLTSTDFNSSSSAIASNASANFHIAQQALDASLRDLKFVPVIPAASASIEMPSASFNLSDQLKAPVASQLYPLPLPQSLDSVHLPPGLDSSAVQPSFSDSGLGLGLDSIASMQHIQYPSFSGAVQQELTSSVDALRLPPAYGEIYPQAQIYSNVGLENSLVSFPQAAQPQWAAGPTPTPIYSTKIPNQMNQPEFFSNGLPDVQPQSTTDTLPSLPPDTVSAPPVSYLNIPPNPKMNPRPRYSPYNNPKPPKFSAYFHPWMRNDPTLGRLWGFDRLPERDSSFTRPIYIQWRPPRDPSLRWTLSGNIKGKKYGCLGLDSEDSDDDSGDDSDDSDESGSEPEEVTVTKKRRTTQIRKRRLEEDDALERSPEKRRKGDPTPPLKSILPHDQVVESNRLKRSREEEDEETDSDSDDQADARSPSTPLTKKPRTEDILESPSREKRRLQDDDEEENSDVPSSGAVKKRKIVDGYIPTKSLPGTFIADPTLTSSSNIRRTPRRRSPSPVVLHRKPSRKIRVWKAVKNAFQSFWA